MNDIPQLMLPTLLLLYAGLTIADTREYRRFAALDATAARQRTLWKWGVQSMCVHGLLSLACLAILDQMSVLTTMPDPLHALAERLVFEGDGRLDSIMKGLRHALLPALVAGVVGMSFARAALEQKSAAGNESDTLVDRRNLEPLLPRNGRERLATAFLAVNAGVSEEIAFRVLLPLLFWQVFGSAAIAIVVPAIVFGLVHAYQGAIGVLATTFAALFFFLVYVVSGSLWTVVAVHATIDLGTLVLVPWFADRLAAKRAARA